MYRLDAVGRIVPTSPQLAVTAPQHHALLAALAGPATAVQQTPPPSPVPVASLATDPRREGVGSDPTSDLARFPAAPAPADRLSRGDLGLQPKLIEISDPAGVVGETSDEGSSPDKVRALGKRSARALRRRRKQDPGPEMCRGLRKPRTRRLRTLVPHLPEILGPPVSTAVR